MKTLLWLDDYRDPMENDWLNFSPIVQPFDVYWVKSYDEFVEWINLHGLPTAICFDHDLSDFQAFYTGSPEFYDDTPEMTEKYAQEKTGMDCAKWLVDYCLDNKEKLPLFASQSSNPGGRENILSLLTNFKKHEVLGPSDSHQDLHEEFVNRITDTEVPEWLAVKYAEQAWGEHPEHPEK